MMRRIYRITTLIALAAALCSCAKAVSEGANDADKRYFDAWISLQKTPLERAGRGIYVYPESVVDGTGATVEKDGFAIVRYKCTDLNGNITSYTYKDAAEQLGLDSPSEYYGVEVITTADETIQAGVADGILGMKAAGIEGGKANEGGQKKFIVPSWLMSYSNYSDEASYLAESSDQSTTIFDIQVVDFAKNINDWQLDRMVDCFNKADFYNGAFAGTQVEDSTSLGFYFKMLNKVPNGKDFPSDTTIYINYTGRLLDLEIYDNGLMFDTSIMNVAKDNYIYDSSRTYEPAAIKWAEKHGEITMDGNSLVSGFTQTLWNMANCGTGTRAVGVFYSDLGYGYSGSGSIPAYAPLVFEIEIVDKPE